MWEAVIIQFGWLGRLEAQHPKTGFIDTYHIHFLKIVSVLLGVIWLSLSTFYRSHFVCLFRVPRCRLFSPLPPRQPCWPRFLDWGSHWTSVTWPHPSLLSVLSSANSCLLPAPLNGDIHLVSFLHLQIFLHIFFVRKPIESQESQSLDNWGLNKYCISFF